MKKSEKGLTLLELVISMVLLGLVTTSSFYALLSAQYMSEEARGKLLALNAARSVLEAVKDAPIQDISTINLANYVPVLPQAAVTLLTNPSPVGTAQLATVTVRVTWLGPKSMARVLELTTMRSNLRS